MLGGGARDLDDSTSPRLFAGAVPEPSSRTIWVWEGSALFPGPAPYGRLGGRPCPLPARRESRRLLFRWDGPVMNCANQKTNCAENTAAHTLARASP